MLALFVLCSSLMQNYVTVLEAGRRFGVLARHGAGLRHPAVLRGAQAGEVRKVRWFCRGQGHRPRGTGRLSAAPCARAANPPGAAPTPDYERMLRPLIAPDRGPMQAPARHAPPSLRAGQPGTKRTGRPGATAGTAARCQAVATTTCDNIFANV